MIGVSDMIGTDAPDYLKLRLGDKANDFRTTGLCQLDGDIPKASASSGDQHGVALLNLGFLKQDVSRNACTSTATARA